MIELISEIFKEGDYVKINYNKSEDYVTGQVYKITSNSLAIITTEGKKICIKGEVINSFEEVECEVQTNEQIEDGEQGSETPIPTHNDSSVEESPICPEASTKGKKNYKPGDVLSKEEMTRIDQKAFFKNRFSTPKRTQKDKEEEELSDFFTHLNKNAENLQPLIPPMGEVKLIASDKNYGFIVDGKTGKDIYFKLYEIVDSKLKDLSRISGESVVYSIVKNNKGSVATAIHKGGSIYEVLKIVDSLVKDRDWERAKQVIEHIIEKYPDDCNVIQCKKKIEGIISRQKTKEWSNTYDQAKQYQRNKEFKLAIEYYQRTIEEGIKAESAIKDLGMLYVQIYKGEENVVEKEKIQKTAIEYIRNREELLSVETSTLSFLETFYYSIKSFDNFLEISDQIIEDKNFTDNKLAISLTKRAVVYLQLKQQDVALQELEKALKYDHGCKAAIKLKNSIENPQSEDITLSKDFEFSTELLGLSPYMQHTLDNYNEYTGVPPKVIETKNFNEITLRKIRELIGSNVGRSRERAKYYLTECKLMQMLEPDDPFTLREKLAKYCSDMAKNHISYNSMADIVRFYYNESFSLRTRWDNTARDVSYYLLTYKCKFDDLLRKTSNDISIDTALSQTLECSGIWEGLLTMFMNNSEIENQIVEKLFADDSYKELSIQALNRYGLSISLNASKSQFKDAWDRAIENRTNDYKKIATSIKSIGEVYDIGELADGILKIKNYKKDWICSLDTNRINNIAENIAPAIDNFRKVSGYRNKESNKNNADILIKELIKEINDGPTKLSFESLLPLLEKAYSLLQKSFEEVVRVSEPKLNVELLSSETVVDKDGNVSIQIAVSNDKDSSPIREVSLTIENSKDLTFLQGDSIIYNAIDGGEKHIFKLKVRVSQEVMKNKATTITTHCQYKNRDAIKSYQSQLSLRLYSSDEFSKIENPYAPVADGGPVPFGSKMFYGREDFIKNIVEAILKSSSKQVIIYGQKRCGKSSVLSHLKGQLKITGETFCVQFSLGEIIGNLTEFSFYHKILEVISAELEELEMDEKNVPSVNFPTINDFKAEDPDNPINTFIKYLIKFKAACRQTPGWESKKLVVLIDEFTYLYSGIKHGQISESIMKQWKAITQNERAQFSVVLVGQDVVPSFKKEDYASNAFGVIQDIRLTYLKDEPARDLIEKPILNENGKSRYIGNAVSKIIEWTSKNPYYIQIFCARLVDTMNRKSLISVTEADVNEVAQTFVVGSEALTEDKFDNLIRAGESEDLQEYKEDDILAVLRQIASHSQNTGYCKREDINALENKEEETAIVKHLYDREVLEKNGENNYRIQVKLFQEWLLNH